MPFWMLIGVLLAWDHSGEPYVTRWLLVVDGIERDVTANVQLVGPTVLQPGDEPCESCKEWRVWVPDIYRGQRITARACNDAGCSPESLPASGLASPTSLRVR